MFARTAMEETMVSAKVRMLVAISLALLLYGTVPAPAQSVAEFYKGKTIQIIVGFGVGGGYDLYARALGRYLGKYVPGQPTVVVQNLEGAGSVRAANHVYSGSPPAIRTCRCISCSAARAHGSKPPACSGSAAWQIPTALFTRGTPAASKRSRMRSTPKSPWGRWATRLIPL